jgi:hypothetical protein
MGLLNPLRQFPNRMNVFSIARSLLAKGIQNSIILPLKVLINPHGKPPENSRDADAQAKPPQDPGQNPGPTSRHFYI